MLNLQWVIGLWNLEDWSGRHDKSHFSDWSLYNISIARHIKSSSSRHIISKARHTIKTIGFIFIQEKLCRMNSAWPINWIYMSSENRICIHFMRLTFSFQFFYLKNWVLPKIIELYDTMTIYNFYNEIYNVFCYREVNYDLRRTFNNNVIRLHKIHGLIDLLFPFHLWFG